MTDNLAKYLIELRNFRLAPHLRQELPLDCRERTLHVEALVIMLKERFLVFFPEREHPLPYGRQLIITVLRSPMNPIEPYLLDA
ncbi:MAG: hypothetical protein HY364_04235 [Candidatus Aenigmarchaeota archaeon]|nr:hypothetical protein [Candidatus Aenigmarchaeota archaeon]